MQTCKTEKKKPAQPRLGGLGAIMNTVIYKCINTLTVRSSLPLTTISFVVNDVDRTVLLTKTIRQVEDSLNSPLKSCLTIFLYTCTSAWN